MAADKGKVKAALDVKYKGKSLSKNFKESFAAHAAELIDNDEGIDEYINNHDAYINLSIAEADRRTTEAVQKRNAEIAAAASGTTDTDPKQDDPAKPAVPDDAPAWAKALIDQNQKLNDTVNGLLQARQTESITDRFKKDDRLKGIPEALLKGRIPSKEEDFEAAVTEAVTDLKPLVEKMSLSGFGTDATPAGSKTPAGGTKEASADAIKAVMGQL